MEGDAMGRLIAFVVVALAHIRRGAMRLTYALGLMVVLYAAPAWGDAATATKFLTWPMFAKLGYVQGPVDVMVGLGATCPETASCAMILMYAQVDAEKHPEIGSMDAVIHAMTLAGCKPSPFEKREEGK